MSTPPRGAAGSRYFTFFAVRVPPPWLSVISVATPEASVVNVTWVAEPARPGKYAVWLEWACDNGTAGNAYQLVTGSQKLTGKVKGTGTWDDYKREKVGEITLRLGKQRLTFRSDGPVSGAMIDLKSIELIPVARE